MFLIASSHFYYMQTKTTTMNKCNFFFESQKCKVAKMANTYCDHYKFKEKKGANTMNWTYQWQCNADSSHNSEHYRLQLLVAVGFLPGDLSGIWRDGSNLLQQ